MRTRPKRRGRHDYNPNDSSDALGKNSYEEHEKAKPKPRRGTLYSNDWSVRPSTQRRAAKYVNHEIEQVPPASESSETPDQQSHRLSHNSYTLRERKRMRISRGAIVAAIVMAALLVAAVSAVTVYRRSLDAGLKDDLESGVLDMLDTGASTSSDDITTVASVEYSLLVGLDDDGSGGLVADAVMIARTDREAGTIALISVPYDLRVPTTDHGKVPLADTRALGGQTLLLDTVSTLFGIEFSHYIEVDVAAFNGLVDEVGGIWVDVPANTNVGGVTVKEGHQHIDGAQATVVSRSEDGYTDGIETRMRNQLSLLSSLLPAVLAKTGLQTIPIANILADSITTDLGYADLSDYSKAFQNATFHTGIVPHTRQVLDGVEYSILDRDGWDTLSASLDTGGLDAVDATLEDSTVPNVDASGLRVTVLNGSGVEGCAQQAATRLEAAGFAIESTGNAAMFVYDETLVVYDEDAQEASAQAVIAALGQGRAVQNPGSYVFDGDILVVVGGNWEP